MRQARQTRSFPISLDIGPSLLCCACGVSGWAGIECNSSILRGTTEVQVCFEMAKVSRDKLNKDVLEIDMTHPLFDLAGGLE